MTDLPDETSVPSGLEDVAEEVARRFDHTVNRLKDLVEVPSISFAGHDRETVRRSAELTERHLEAAGLKEVRRLELGDVHPYVYGEWLEAGEDAPTVLLYAHHDVQPVGTPDNWTSPPFEPTERDGRLYGRGAADDKAGIMVHVAAVEAWLRTRETLPVNVKVIIEGEEEIGSPHLTEFLHAYRELLDADVIVLTDLTNWKVGWPGLTYSLRGMGELYVTLRALEQPVHSGMWGGPIPDALTGLTRLLACLHDDQGRPAVPGFHDDVRGPSQRERELIGALGDDADAIREEAGVLDGVAWTGDPDLGLWERIWLQPAITVIGIDAPSVRDASNQLVAEARAKISLRFAPGQDPDRGLRLVEEHLRAHVPWGMQLHTEVGARNPAWVTDPEGPAFDAAMAAMTAAYGRAPALIGCGGSIPFVKPFSDAFGGAPCLLTGVEDPRTNAHGEDESLHLGDFLKACLSEALLFEELAGRADLLRR